MGGKPRAATTDEIAKFIAAIPVEQKSTFTALRDKIRRLAPQAAEDLKWGTLQYNINGSLFALSSAKKHLNFYILTKGVIAAHQAELADIPQSNCCLRFTPGAELPPGIDNVMRAAIALKSP